jgi:phospholipid/cholesterol/gamma-HCH transport system permease protein
MIHSNTETYSTPKKKIYNIFSSIGRSSLELIKSLGSYGNLCIQIAKELCFPPFYFHLLLEQLMKIGNRSLFLVLVTGLATGSVMALQFGVGLAKFGGTMYIPKLVALAVLREMAPVFTSLLLAGRIGSGIAAEVASMKVTQQIDAIRALGTSPIKRIVIPRVLASLIAFPVLTVFSNYIALFGAMIVADAEFNIHPQYFIIKVIETVTINDLVGGLIKTIVFAFFISVTACWKGLNTEKGTQGVGETTTWVVVASSIFIMVSDFFLTKIFIQFVYVN